MSESNSGPSRDAVLQAIEANQGEFELFFGHVAGGEIHRNSSIQWSYTGTPWLNTVCGARLTADSVDAAVTELLEWFSARRVGFSWLTGASTRPTNLEAYLVNHYGFVHESTSPGMALDLAQLPEPPPFPSPLTLHEVTEMDTLRTYANLGKNPFILQLGLGGHPPWRHYLGRWEGTPVGTSMMFDAAGVVGLHYVGTVAEMRRRGIGTAMCWHTLHQARSHGHRMAILVASELGESIYRKLGFLEYCKISRYCWSP